MNARHLISSSSPLFLSLALTLALSLVHWSGDSTKQHRGVLQPFCVSQGVPGSVIVAPPLFSSFGLHCHRRRYGRWPPPRLCNASAAVKEEAHTVTDGAYFSLSSSLFPPLGGTGMNSSEFHFDSFLSHGQASFQVSASSLISQASRTVANELTDWTTAPYS